MASAARRSPAAGVPSDTGNVDAGDSRTTVRAAAATRTGERRGRAAAAGCRGRPGASAADSRALPRPEGQPPPGARFRNSPSASRHGRGEPPGHARPAAWPAAAGGRVKVRQRSGSGSAGSGERPRFGTATAGHGGTALATAGPGGSRGNRSGVPAAAAATASRRHEALRRRCVARSMTDLSRQERSHRRRRQQAVDLVGDRAGGRRGGRAPRAHLSRSGSKSTSASSPTTLTPDRWCCRSTCQNDAADRRACSRRIEQEFGGLDFLVHGVAFANATSSPTRSCRPRARASASRSTSAPTR